MPPRQKRSVFRKQQIFGRDSGRGLKILTQVFVPDPGALSETSDNSESECENELLDNRKPNLPPSDDSSPAPSISQSLQDLIDIDDGEEFDEEEKISEKSYKHLETNDISEEGQIAIRVYEKDTLPELASNPACSPLVMSASVNPPASPSIIEAVSTSPVKSAALPPVIPQISQSQSFIQPASLSSVISPASPSIIKPTSPSIIQDTSPSKLLPTSPSIVEPSNILLDNIIQEVCPPSPLVPNYDMIPSISSLPSLPSVSPATPTSCPVKNKKYIKKRYTQAVSPKKLRSRKSNIKANSSSTGIPFSSKKTLSSSLQRPSTSSVSASTSATSSTHKRKSKDSSALVESVKKRKTIRDFRLIFNWTKGIYKHRAEIEYDDGEYIDIPDCNSPLDHFNKFFSPDLITDIVKQTNMYSVQCTGKSTQLTEGELRNFIARHIIMGVIDMPSYLDYWSQRYRYPLVADIMPLKRYQTIRRFLHFNDNYQADSDRYYKIRPVLEKVRQNCLAQEQEHKFSVDEMMVPYKGTKAGKRRQYMKDKPTKWGFKIYVRAGISGSIYDFIIYGGEDTFRFHEFTAEEKGLGFGGQVVIALCKSIKNIPAMVYCDNFFSSPELFVLLRENYGVFGLGTIRGNRLRGAASLLPTDKVLQKTPRGTYSQVVCDQNKMAIVKWNDNKAVTFISTFVAAEPVGTIKRHCSTVKRKVDVDCPQVVQQYNKHMGGVDLADMLIALYRTPFKSRRWYLGIFVHLLDICINNAWLLYRSRRSPKTSLKEFRYELYDNLLKLGRSEKRRKEQISGKMKKVQNPTKPRPQSPIRFDDVGHFPSIGSNGRCRNCKLKTTVTCIKCNIRLCFITGSGQRNCFLDFHTK